MNPISQSGPWALGTLIWLPACALIVLGLVFVGAVLWRADHYDDQPVAVGLWLAALCFIVGTAFFMWPYNSEFHQWRSVKGDVQQVSKRLVADGKAMSERYVVVIQGQPFAVDDTRASLLEPGDAVSLSCKREWQYASESGWACRWNGATR